MAEDPRFSLTLHQVEDFEFDVRFDWEHLPPLRLDEPEPIGRGKGPNAARLVGAAVGNCLSASLLFCLRKSRVEIVGIETRVEGELRRNDRGRLRLGRIDVEITLETAGTDPKRLARCLELFEDYCVVTASVRQGVPVGVRVIDPEGNELYQVPGAQAP